MDFSIRGALSADEPFLREMLYEALFVPPGFPEFPRSILNVPNLAKYVEGFGTQPGDLGRIAERDGTPLGAAWGRIQSAEDPGYGFVDEDTPELSVALVPDIRGNGVGSALLESILEEAPRLSLNCDDRNPAIAFYERFGFVIVDRDDHSVTMLREG